MASPKRPLSKAQRQQRRDASQRAALARNLNLRPNIRATTGGPRVPFSEQHHQLINELMGALRGRGVGSIKGASAIRGFTRREYLDARGRYLEIESRIDASDTESNIARGDAQIKAERWLRAQGIPDRVITAHSLGVVALLRRKSEGRKSESRARQALNEVLRDVRRLRLEGHSRKSIERIMDGRTRAAQRRKGVNEHQSRWLEMIFYEKLDS